MGLFSKLKSVVNSVTGGGAVVSLGYEEGSISSPFIVNVLVEVKDADIDAANVYLKYRAFEELLNKNMDEETGEVIEDWEVGEVYDKTFEAAGGQVLKAGEKYNFEVELDLADSNLVSFQGEERRVKCTLYAGIDCSGNDPDSGSKIINVSV